MPKDIKSDRRKVLQGSGLALAGLIGGTNAVAAKPKKEHNSTNLKLPEFINYKGNKLELSIDKSEYHQRIADNDGDDKDIVYPPYKVIRDLIEDLNNNIESGRYNIKKKENKIKLKINEDNETMEVLK